MTGAHETMGHRGVEATVEKARRHFWFHTMTKVAEDVVRTCEVCQRRDKKNPDQRYTLVSQRVGYPFQKLSVDFVGPLPRSTKGNEYLLTVRDTFTRWIEAFPVKDATAEAVVRMLTREIFPRFGLCEQLHSDRGSQFMSQLVHEVARMLGIKKTETPAYNPKSNPVERAHRDLGRAIRAQVSERPREWEKVLPHVLFIMRTATCRSTGTSPYRMLFGRDPTFALDLAFGPPPYTQEEHKSEVEYVEKLRKDIERTHAWARRNMCETIRRQRQSYFKDRPSPFAPGDRVWLFTPRVLGAANKSTTRRKFNTYWTGPWSVKKQVNELCYELNPDTRWTFFQKSIVVSVDRLKRFYPQECDEHFTQPPTAADQVEMPGDEFAENVHHDDYEGEVGEEQQPPLLIGEDGAGPPPDAPPGAPPPGQNGGGGGGGNPVVEDDDEEVEIIQHRPAPVPHGVRIDAERARLAQERQELGERRQAAQDAREERARQREERRQDRPPPPQRGQSPATPEQRRRGLMGQVGTLEEEEEPPQPVGEAPPDSWTEADGQKKEGE